MFLRPPADCLTFLSLSSSLSIFPSKTFHLHTYIQSQLYINFFQEVKHLDDPKTPKHTHGLCKALNWKPCSTLILPLWVLLSLYLVLLYHKFIQCVPKGVSFCTIKHSKFQLSKLIPSLISQTCIWVVLILYQKKKHSKFF